MGIPFDDEINELAREIAEATLDEEVDEEYEKLMDLLYAEHQALQYAANSYDNG